MPADVARVALFPLSNVVLFPRVKTPLHIFEPRYRQMMRDVLEADRHVAMTVVRPEHQGDGGGTEQRQLPVREHHLLDDAVEPVEEARPPQCEEKEKQREGEHAVRRGHRPNDVVPHLPSLPLTRAQHCRRANPAGAAQSGFTMNA